MHIGRMFNVSSPCILEAFVICQSMCLGRLCNISSPCCFEACVMFPVHSYWTGV